MVYNKEEIKWNVHFLQLQFDNNFLKMLSKWLFQAKFKTISVSKKICQMKKILYNNFRQKF